MRMVLRLVFAPWLVALSASCGLAGPSSYPLVPADAVFQGMPGAPSVPTVGGDQVDHMGYQAAGDLRLSAAIASKRAANLDDPYDVDLTLRLIFAPSSERAARLFDEEVTQDRKLAQNPILHAPPQGLRAQQLVVWQAGTNGKTIVASARYGNYLIRYAGRIADGGYFPDPASFLDFLRAMDGHLVRTFVKVG